MASTCGAKRKAVDIATKVAIVTDLARGEKNSDLARKYGLSRSTISTIAKDKEKFLHATINADPTTRKRIRKATYADVEDALLKWFVDARSRNIPISGPLMLSKAKDFAFLLDFPDFSPGNGWLHRFKVRHGIVFKGVAGEAASVNMEDVNTWLDENIATIVSYSAQDVYNADETALFYQMLPAKTHALKGDKCSGGKNSKLRITVLLCTNMDGSDRRLPFVIGKYQKPRCFGHYVPVRYRHNKKAWMTRDLFAEWLVEFDRDMARQKRKVLLVLDNCAAHHVKPSLAAVTVLFLPPNATSKIQPLDLGIIHAFKVCYRRRLVQRLLIAIDRPTVDIPLRISLFGAVEMIKASWMEISSQCILHCFRKAGFMDAVNEDDAVVDTCQQDGLHEELWKRVVDADLADPSIDWDDFVGADDGADIAEPFTDEGIVSEVRAECDPQDSDENDENAEPPPATVSSSVAIEYIASLKRLVCSKELGDDHLAALNKLESAVISSAFGAQARITDFFSK
ncbi:tigger transposable element-derived protein 6-like [Ornithodoros turicata]|uniref:tigger transposable element-derived protein 6-like n=1 Tax=Ornithodoros turicata TaxID=34597 RepID=UPI003139027B